MTSALIAMLRARSSSFSDLRPQVVGIEALVALEALFAGETFVVEDGVDPHGVRVGAGARTDDDDLASHFLGARLDLFAGQRLLRDLLDVNGSEIDRVHRAAVDDEVAVPPRGLLHRRDERLQEAVRLGEALGRFTPFVAWVDGERERHLHHAVAFAVAVRA